jgi:hypothetical protein
MVGEMQFCLTLQMMGVVAMELLWVAVMPMMPVFVPMSDFEPAAMLQIHLIVLQKDLKVL